jgi:hypothetical protein
MACYTRSSGPRGLVVPAAGLLRRKHASPDAHRARSLSAAVGIPVTLASSAPWLFAGTALTVAIALGRSYRPFQYGIATPAAGRLGRGASG